jgi:hypothetical protein
VPCDGRAGEYEIGGGIDGRDGERRFGGDRERLREREVVFGSYAEGGKPGAEFWRLGLLSEDVRERDDVELDLLGVKLVLEFPPNV